jgi:hypothetical protein
VHSGVPVVAALVLDAVVTADVWAADVVVAADAGWFVRCERAADGVVPPSAPEPSEPQPVRTRAQAAAASRDRVVFMSFGRPAARLVASRGPLSARPG